jgi:hypothetical protein
MMLMSIVLSERQRPRAIQYMKSVYDWHVHDPSCGLGAACPKMVELKQRIEELEAEEAHLRDSRSLQLG